MALEKIIERNSIANLRCGPAIPPHAESQLIGTAFGLSEDDSFALAFAHNLTHKSQQFVLLKNAFFKVSKNQNLALSY